MIDTDVAYQSYSEHSFWSKLRNFGGKAGYETVEKALWLFYAARKPEVPIKVKTAIWSALGYFILPLDLIPDITPVAGFGDDVSVLLAALLIAASYIDDDVKARTSKKLCDWFGPRPSLS